MISLYFPCQHQKQTIPRMLSQGCKQRGTLGPSSLLVQHWQPCPRLIPQGVFRGNYFQVKSQSTRHCMSNTRVCIFSEKSRGMHTLDVHLLSGFWNFQDELFSEGLEITLTYAVLELFYMWWSSTVVVALASRGSGHFIFWFCLIWWVLGIQQIPRPLEHKEQK